MLDPKVSNWINFMRAIKLRYPQLEHISRRYFYPYASVRYNTFKTKYGKLNRYNFIELVKKEFEL